MCCSILQDPAFWSKNIWSTDISSTQSLVEMSVALINIFCIKVCSDVLSGEHTRAFFLALSLSYNGTQLDNSLLMQCMLSKMPVGQMFFYQKPRSQFIIVFKWTLKKLPIWTTFNVFKPFPVQCLCCSFLSTWHFINFPFHKFVISFIFFYFTISSTWHFVNSTFNLLITLSTCHFTKLPFHQLNHFMTLSFHQPAILSTWPFINVLFQLLTISSTCQFIKSHLNCFI